MVSGTLTALSWDEKAMNLTIELPDDKRPVLIAKALEHGVSAEQYAGQVLQHDLEATTPTKQPISEIFKEIWGDMPADARAKLPRDGASQVDHYVYGLPKRDL